MKSPIRVLVVEDEVILAEDLRESLQRQSYLVVDTADNAEDAFRIATKTLPDIIMMDIHLRGKTDGIAAAARIREELGLPVVFLTAHSDPATLDRAKLSTPYGYLIKPFEEKELRTTIEIALYRHQADTQLLQMERWLRTTLHSIGDAVLTVDISCRITFINPIAEQITGWSRREAIGQYYQEVFALHDEEGTILENPIEPILLSGETLHFDENYRIRTQEGQLVRIDDSIAPVRDEAGDVNGAIIIFRDKTEKWELDQRRLEAEARQQEGKRLESLGILAAGVAHDFNNLLTIIRGHAELISMSRNLSDSNVAASSEIIEASRRAAHLCEQMLSYGDTEKLVLCPTDTGKIIECTEQLLRIQFSDTINTHIDVPSDLPLILAHSGRVQQLLTNLILNSVEACGENPGQIDLRASLVDEVPPSARINHLVSGSSGPWVCFEVEDNGMGMEAQILERVFDPFYSTKFTGRGLGMSVVYGVVQSHQGALEISSTIGRGTRVRVFMPATETRSTEPLVPSRVEWRPANLGRALILDDEPNVRSVLAKYFYSLGYIPDQAALPHEAIELLLSNLVDYSVVILDLTMPEASGIDVLNQIRNIQANLPVILISGYAAAAIPDTVTRDPFTEFVHKPFGRENILSVLAKLENTATESAP